MPSAWPAFGKSLLPDILDGDSDKQIQAVWNYLRDGNRARPPAGLVVNTMELIPTDEAVIYRNFIQGAGARAIGVGYPEAINLAFDANDLRLALIWKPCPAVGVLSQLCSFHRMFRTNKLVMRRVRCQTF